MFRFFFYEKKQKQKNILGRSLGAGGPYPGEKIFPYQFRIASHPQNHKKTLNTCIFDQNILFDETRREGD